MSSSLNLAYFLRGSRGGFCRWKRIDGRRKEDRDRHGKRERYIYIYIYIKDQEQRAGSFEDVLQKIFLSRLYCHPNLELRVENFIPFPLVLW